MSKWEQWRDRAETEQRWAFARKRGAPDIDALLLEDGEAFMGLYELHFCEIERRGEQYRVRYTRGEDLCD